MSSILQHIISFVLVYRYVGLFVISFLSSLGIPVPAAITAIAAAAFASQGYLNIIILIVIGALGNILGDLTMYWLVRLYGKRVLYWLGLRKIAESVALKDVESTVNRYSAFVIIASRFQDQATTIVNIISGLGRMKIKRFAWLISIGDVIQITFYVLLGYLFADNWQAIYGAVGKLSWIIALIVALVVVIFATQLMKKALNNNKNLDNKN
jgi:membrane protein DedA with SNARE-associated domain